MNPLQEFLVARVPRGKKDKPNYGPLAKATELTLSGFLRGVKQGTFDPITCLKIALALGENPVLVLRAAGKEEEANVLDRIYEAPRRFLSEADWDHIKLLHAAPAAKRHAVAILLDSPIAHMHAPPEDGGEQKRRKENRAAEGEFHEPAAAKDHPRKSHHSRRGPKTS